MNKYNLQTAILWYMGAILVGGFLVLSCDGGGQGRQAESADRTQIDVHKYHAAITPLNEGKTGDHVTGEATLTVRGDELTIRITVEGLSDSDMHLQHYHGFVDGSDASIPTMSQDTNGDGYVDLIETRAVSGITLVPFHENPASLEIAADSYPVAHEGSVFYEKTVSISSLEDKLESVHGIDILQLDKRVIYIHGIDPEHNLPESVQSLEGVPAHVTLPVACGKIKPVSDSPRKINIEHPIIRVCMDGFRLN